MANTLTTMILSTIMNNNTFNNTLDRSIRPTYTNNSYEYPKYKIIDTKPKPILYNSKTMRRNHNIKQPGMDVQRKIQ